MQHACVTYNKDMWTPNSSSKLDIRLHHPTGLVSVGETQFTSDADTEKLKVKAESEPGKHPTVFMINGFI